MGRCRFTEGVRDALACPCGVWGGARGGEGSEWDASASHILPRRTYCAKIQRVEDVEYRPQRSLGTPTLVKACFAATATAILLLLGIGVPAAVYVAGFPAAAGIAWFAAYAGKRRLRARLTAAGIESRRLRTRFVPWTQIRDVKVVNRVTVAHLAVRGSRNGARYGSRSCSPCGPGLAIAGGADPRDWGRASDSDVVTAIVLQNLHDGYRGRVGRGNRGPCARNYWPQWTPVRTRQCGSG